MVLADYADFDIWLGGVIEWVPIIKHVGGCRVWFPNVDKERLYYGNLIEKYAKAGDLEGPLDDDIFENRPPGHARKIFRIIRAFVREQKKRKRATEQQRQEDERNMGADGWFTDASEEDELVSLRGSDDEGPSYLVWNERTDLGNEDLIVGMKFPTKEKYKEIKTIKGKHTCAHLTENKQANYKYLGKRIENIIRDNPNEGLISLKNKIRRDVQIDCSLHKVYRAKRYALQLIKGNIKLQFERLYDYCATVDKYNPGSSLVLKVDRQLCPPVLQRMYFCLSGLKEGFLDECRPIIGLDGCFLKSIYRGQLLTAVGRDGNDNIYPIVMAYVEIEKYDSWEWFLNFLLRDIGSLDEKGWAFIYDRQKGVLEAVSSLAPNAEYRFCLRHMYNNFKAKF
ncbi:UNVERIFIED_CONTAM: hypothetical protein Sindi_1648900 [Sesamum indicum]